MIGDGTDPDPVPRPPLWEPGPRQLPYGPAPQAWWVRAVKAQGTPDDEPATLVALCIDTPTGRHVSFWAPDDVEKLCRALLTHAGKAPDGLVVASLDDLRQLGRDQP